MTSTSTIERSSPMKFMLLVFVLSIPLWLIGTLIPLQLLPGLPVSSLMVLCPLTAALFLAYTEKRTFGISELIKRSFSFRRIGPKAWFIPAFLLMPLIAVLAYLLMQYSGAALPAFQFSIPPALVMFLIFFVAALSEEIGWSGYAIAPMQNRWNAFQASIILGVIWAVWHIFPFIQADRSWSWIFWQCLTLVSSRILLVWLYNNAGKSVLIVALSHTMINVSWQLFPVQGSHYDPRITGLITTLVAVIVVFVWGPQTLIRKGVV